MLFLKDRKLIATAEQMLSESKMKMEVIRMQILQLKTSSAVTSPEAPKSPGSSLPIGIKCLQIYLSVALYNLVKVVTLLLCITW